ncbi:IclR family transcriptional regulator [Micromonospora kangleipakensis]|uniref:IclR family transcriptional regulator n=1 Tax=Micromonospora kangleipakensis TaxID=1077942 RepID=A0A4Q8BCK0_9ACTN|nr:IclR family transcriptional regulator [Micromonospora kangleipakensis]RZU74985.1 IclR family transcriptional regulator [Micromonospora kangleipakensis]
MDDHTVTGRVMAVLEAVGALEEAATLAALTRHTGIPKPTVRRIAADLAARGMLNRDATGYRLGPRLLEFGAQAAWQQGLRQAATPYVQDLFARTREIVWLSVFTETTNVVLETAFGTDRVDDMRRPWPTAIRGAHFLATASGRILLGDRPDLTEYLRSRPLPRMTPYTPTQPEKVLAAIDTARNAGVAIEHEESMRGYNCIAAGVHGPDRRIIGVVGVSGRTGSLAVERLARPLLAAASYIEQAFHRTETT